MESSSIDSPYKRLSYRRLIAWPQRIAREEPFLLGEIERAPRASVLDLGCGTGEHVRHLASRRVRAVGIDRSEDQIEAAREYEDEFPPHGPRFVHGAVEALADLVDERFGAAICLGNVLPHFEDRELAAALAAVAAVLLPGGRFVGQLINYERIFSAGVRHLPINVRPAPEGDAEIVFLRLLKRDGERHVRFFPSTLTLRPGADPPLGIEASKEVRLRAWRRAELEREFARAGFEIDGIYGDMEGGAFAADSSSDLVITAALSTQRHATVEER
jgi:SAM-dependent methyltransferase